VLCHLGKADTALSITLTATATAITLFTIPLWVGAGLASAGATKSQLEMPVLDIALSLAGFTILPVAIGMVMRPTWPRVAVRRGAADRYDRLRDDPPLPAGARAHPRQ
jgi:BASS family bile acid:Na+ symporter